MDRDDPGRCPACGETAMEPWRLASPSDPGLSKRSFYRLERCRSCGSAALADAAGESERRELYEAGTYASTQSPISRLMSPWRRAVEFDRRRLLSDLPPGGRVYEVGAGRGELLATLASQGYEVAGLEPSRTSVAQAAERGVHLENAGLEESEVGEGTCDAVILWHVLEHLDDPAGALGRVRAWISPGGRVVIAVPNLGSLQARLGQDRWFHLDVPRHRTHFTVTGLSRLLNRTGFGIIRVRHVNLEHGPPGMWMTLLNSLTLQPDVPFRMVKGNLVYFRSKDRVRDAIVTLLAGPLLLPVALLLELVAGLLRQGGTIVVEAVPANR